MEAHTDTHLTRGNASQNSLAEGLTVDHEHESGKTALNDDSVSNNLNPSPSDAHLSLVTDSGDVEAHEGQTHVHSFKADQEPSDSQTGRNTINHDPSCIHPQRNSDPAILLTTSREVSPSQCAVISVGGFSSLTSINGEEACTPIYPQGPQMLHARTVSLEKPLCEEREAELIDCSNCIQVPHTELGHVHSTDAARLTNEEEIREDLDYPCELPSSLPPNSSPPQLFLSSPYASSQSSVGDIESSKMVSAVKVEGCASSQECPPRDHVVPDVQDESCLVPKDLYSHDVIDAATSPETEKYYLQTDPTSCTVGGSQHSRKRITYQNDPDEPQGPQPIKRSKQDTDFYLPPTPRRATLASQNRQFKKLAAPFRLPLRLPVVTGGLASTTSNKEAESTISIMPGTNRDKIDTKGSSMHLFPPQHKASNKSRSLTQFKSPLVNRVLPADSRTIRLTPVVQALERKLQLLKRATKVKEDREEEVLTRLAGKWIEAGREVAYEVWDATKNAGNLAGKVIFIRGSYGWESTSNGNNPWGWDSKPADADEECCDLDPSAAPCDAGRPVSEAEEDNVGCNTLGTMLRQLGIAPEIFGWDDEKETFSD